MSGEERGWGASLIRGALSMGEPGYRWIVSFRNRRFDAGRGVRRLPRPVISIGNITAGGTGKTPVVRWLCERLRSEGHHPAILMRGYKSQDGFSDEQRMLDQTLNAANLPLIVVHANPDRFAGGTEVLSRHPETNLFVLDDGFQHRKLARNFDLVLINATEPFGFGHVHPRGLLREPLVELRRANAILITRSNEVPAAQLTELETKLAQYAPQVPIYQSSHAPTRLLEGSTSRPLSDLADKRVFAFCGIGDPNSFLRLLQPLVGVLIGSRAFPDHYSYGESDLTELAHAAKDADVLITTEKDWAKLAVHAPRALPIWRMEMAIRFREGDEENLLEQIPRNAQAKIASTTFPATSVNR